LLHVDTYLKLFDLTLKEPRGAVAILRGWFARLTAPRITVEPLSDDWIRQHERDSGKR